MIELAEAITLAEQMNRTICGKVIQACVRGNAPHKFAFYTKEPEEYARILEGKVVGEAIAKGSAIELHVHPGYALVFGNGGERILYHTDPSTLPAKHQFLLSFTDGTFLTVTVQMWGAAQLFALDELTTDQNFYGYSLVSPVSDAFTEAYFFGLFDALPPQSKDSVKFFLISKPGVAGVGNGYCQDILFRARLHPRHRAVALTVEERHTLYLAIRETMLEAVRLGGRSSEFNLWGQPGQYERLLDSQSAGKPCPDCGTPIEKISFLGGASYLCPACQR
ncbi:MAG: endonuclease VIII [Anaerolineae bacterium]|nr:endonuclease VIII [Anaerolineae bacterium]